MATILTEQILKKYGSIDNYINATEHLRKPREDKGKKRTKYDSSLSKKYKSYLSRANAKGLTMSLSQQEFDAILLKECVYCKLPASTIDRIDSSKGYELDNVQPCCVMCNNMKNKYSHDVFLEHISRIYNNCTTS